MYTNELFDSTNTFYRNPKGAVEEGCDIHFAIILPRSLGCYCAQLMVKYDTDADFSCQSMFWCGMASDEFEMWDCHFKAEKIGLYWHHFRLKTNQGDRYLNPGTPKQKAVLDRSPGSVSWQITCYKKGFKTPEWPQGGIMYQIFPDRFYYSGEKKDNIYPDKTIRENWGEMPEWRPNNNGEITNSDFFMGDLKGIEQKLPYLEELGVTCIYLNPIFEAYSNHRYDTGDYSKIDPALGTEEDFIHLCAEAKRRGIKIINDGVFSHTGSDSVYFNRSGRYETLGAYNSQESPYYPWYNFIQWPNQYNSWWGFYTLPEVDETNPEFNEYINGENGIVRKWLKDGSSGWRLDVADELPDRFIENLRAAAKEESPEALVIGEVWEDASTKQSYGGRRKFLLGNQLDSVMNYPFRAAIIDYIKGAPAEEIMDRIMSLVENYPRPVLNVLMNILGTHDTERILTVLAGEPLNGRDRQWQAEQKLTPEQRYKGIKLLKIAVGIQYTLPGFPCVYYGDEVGMEGYRDPFNRACFPWGKEDKALLEWYKTMGKIRKSCSALAGGEMINAFSSGKQLSYIRHDSKTAIFCAFNTDENNAAIDVPPGYRNGICLAGTKLVDGKLIIPGMGCAFLEITHQNI